MITNEEAANSILSLVVSPLMPRGSVPARLAALTDPDDGHVDWRLSSGEQALVRLAFFAWNGGGGGDLADLFCRVSEPTRTDVLRVLEELYMADTQSPQPGSSQ